MRFTNEGLGAIGLSRVGMFALLVLLSCQSPEAAAQVQEIPVWGMPGIASVQFDRRGQQTIQYNPRTCARLGPELCEFFRAHEYGHIALNHLGRRTPARRAEYEADVWAARNVSPAARVAAVEFFGSGRGGSFVHGSALARAQRVSGAPRTQGVSQKLARPDGTRVVRQSYSAAPSRAFNTQGVRTLFRRNPRWGR